MGFIEMPELSAIIRGTMKAAEGEVVYREALTKSAIIVQSIARHNAPVRSGKLRASINYKVNAMTAIITPQVNYAGYVEGGRGEVVPVNKRVLATKINPGWGNKTKSGYFIIGKRSKAVAPNPFMHKSEKEAKPLVAEVFLGRLREIRMGMK
jgi:hypothetical protein